MAAALTRVVLGLWWRRAGHWGRGLALATAASDPSPNARRGRYPPPSFMIRNETLTRRPPLVPCCLEDRRGEWVEPASCYDPSCTELDTRGDTQRGASGGPLTAPQARDVVRRWGAGLPQPRDTTGTTNAGTSPLRCSPSWHGTQSVAPLPTSHSAGQALASGLVLIPCSLSRSEKPIRWWAERSAVLPQAMQRW